MRIRLLLGDCVERLRLVDEGSVGAVVCDPPYGLEFMGKEWDRLQGYTTDVDFKGFVLPRQRRRNVKCPDCGKWVYDHPPRACICGGVTRLQQRTMEDWHVNWLTAVFRVLQPGGQVKAFSGTRTFHRLAGAMESAGFAELHLEAWGYGSGFPKSMDVGKAIDRQWGRLNSGSSLVSLKKELKGLFDASGKSRKAIDEECGFRACNYLSYPEEGKRPDPWFAVLPSGEKWQVIKRVLGIEANPTLEERLDQVFAEAEREVIGFRKAAPGVAFSSNGPTEIPVTLPATPEAELWDGWGTALKPAWEPVLVGTKPG